VLPDLERRPALHGRSGQHGAVTRAGRDFLDLVDEDQAAALSAQPLPFRGA